MILCAGVAAEENEEEGSERGIDLLGIHADELNLDPTVDLSLCGRDECPVWQGRT